MINGSLPLFVFEFFNTNIEEEEFLLGDLPPHISNSSVNKKKHICFLKGELQCKTTQKGMKEGLFVCLFVCNLIFV